jgi:hypothetical protein
VFADSGGDPPFAVRRRVDGCHRREGLFERELVDQAELVAEWVLQNRPVDQRSVLAA